MIQENVFPIRITSSQINANVSTCEQRKAARDKANQHSHLALGFSRSDLTQESWHRLTPSEHWAMLCGPIPFTPLPRPLPLWSRSCTLAFGFAPEGLFPQRSVLLQGSLLFTGPWGGLILKVFVHLPIHPSVHLPIYPPPTIIHLIYPFTDSPLLHHSFILSITMTHLIHPFIEPHFSIIHLPLYPSIYPLSIPPSTHPSIHPYIHPPIHPPTHHPSSIHPFPLSPSIHFPLATWSTPQGLLGHTWKIYMSVEKPGCAGLLGALGRGH